MAKLPTYGDPTLEAADRALVAASKQRKPNSLGASWLGDECERRIWLKFRHARMEAFQPITLKRFEDGHRTEDVVIARLKAVEGIELHDRDPDTGEQFGFKHFGGHLSGKYDGVMLGLIQAPKAWHIFEGKASEKWEGLSKAKDKLGEKSALANWNPGYHVQAQLYMHFENVDRHYIVCASPGARFWSSARTNYDPVMALKLVAKAERLIFSDTAPERIGDATNWLCRMCHMAGICHGDELPDRECRNCLTLRPCAKAGGGARMGGILVWLVRGTALFREH